MKFKNCFKVILFIPVKERQNPPQNEFRREFGKTPRIESILYWYKVKKLCIEVI